MQPREPVSTGQTDMFRARLEQIIDLEHPIARLGRAINWDHLVEKCGAVYTDRVGRPPLATRLMVGPS
jgi:transposase, IS5 family